MANLIGLLEFTFVPFFNAFCHFNGEMRFPKFNLIFNLSQIICQGIIIY